MKNDYMKKLKILYAASTESHLRRFHQPYLEALSGEFTVMTMANGEGADWDVPFQKSVFSIKNLGAVRLIRKILKKERFDAVILNTSLAAFLIRVSMIGMSRRPKVLNVVHGYLFDLPTKGMKDRLMLRCEKITAPYTDEIAVMNQADLKIAQEHKLSRGGIRFLDGMGFTLAREKCVFDPILRQEIAADGSYLMTFVGELSARKNQIFLIRCVARLRAMGIPAVLLLVGEGSERASLEKEISESGLAQYVRLVGNQEPVSPYLAITDLYVSASRIEGLPFNLMEAMAAGLPIVASDCKGQTDLLAEVPDCVYPLEDEAAFCEAVKKAYESGVKGIGSVTYPNLRRYTLEAVFQSNLNYMKGFFSDESRES